jgi:hypothetical protein
MYCSFFLEMGDVLVVVATCYFLLLLLGNYVSASVISIWIDKVDYSVLGSKLWSLNSQQYFFLWLPLYFLWLRVQILENWEVHIIDRATGDRLLPYTAQLKWKMGCRLWTGSCLGEVGADKCNPYRCSIMNKPWSNSRCWHVLGQTSESSGMPVLPPWTTKKDRLSSGIGRLEF